MFSNLGTKLAMRKLGIKKDTFDVPSWSSPEPTNTKTSSSVAGAGAGAVDGSTAGTAGTAGSAWPAWMSVKSLPITVQPWLTPAPPPVPVAALPNLGSVAPADRDGLLVVGRGARVLVVFLRCVGCAFAQQTFLALRDLASRHAGSVICMAVSHSSRAATERWVSLVGGAGLVRVVVDEDRAVYAAWGLGLGSVWHVLNPTSQMAGFRAKTGWLGSAVATSIQRKGLGGPGRSELDADRLERERERERRARAAAAGVGQGQQQQQQQQQKDLGGQANGVGGGGPDLVADTALGSKWQESGAWAVDARGVVVWGGKAARADDVMSLEEGIRALGV